MRGAPLVVIFSVLVSLWGAPAAAQQNTSKTIDVSRYMPRKPYFTKVEGSTTWQAVYESKNAPSITVTIIGIKNGQDEMLVLQASLGSRSSIPLSRNLALRFLEMNSDYDHVKIVLYTDYVAMRHDVAIKSLDADQIDTMCANLATAADAALGEIKNFQP